MVKKVILAYSGGLDTSVILKWLKDKGYDVIAYMADLGQKEDFEASKEKALNIGASKVYVEDLKKEFVTNYIFPAFKANSVYENGYLLGTSLARPLIAKKQIEIAIKEGAKYVSHGATGKGNDQVRFELAYYALKPDIKIISPWKDKEFLEKFSGRQDLIKYAKKKKIPIKATREKSYSEDENLLHTSHESGMLEDPNIEANEEVYSLTRSLRAAPDKFTRICIDFKDGIPTKVTNIENNESFNDPLDLFVYLNKLGIENGIGRLDMVENRFLGIKSRGVYETPGGTILNIAHKDIEGVAMDREVMRLRDMLSTKLAELIYNGFWFSPEMEFLMSAIDKSQEAIDGKVYLKLYKGNVYPYARISPVSLYNKDISSMDIEGGFNQQDSVGFIKINAIRLMAHHEVMKGRLNK